MYYKKVIGLDFKIRALIFCKINSNVYLIFIWTRKSQKGNTTCHWWVMDVPCLSGTIVFLYVEQGRSKFSPSERYIRTPM